MRSEECDICGKKTNHLSDYYAMMCQDCIIKHTDMVLIRIIGNLINKLEDKDIEIKSKNNKNLSLVAFKYKKDMENFFHEMEQKYGIEKFHEMNPHGNEMGDNLNIVYFTKPAQMSYTKYDDILISIVVVLGYDSFKDKGILIGHFDNELYLWTDYKQFSGDKELKELIKGCEEKNNGNNNN